MEELAKTQMRVGEDLQRIISNYKKDPSSRKTLAYLEERIRRLDTLWDEFEATDNVIRTSHSDRKDHLYFTKDYYTSIREIYDLYREQMTSTILSIRQERPQSSALANSPRLQDDNPFITEEAQGQSNDFVGKPLPLATNGGAQKPEYKRQMDATANENIDHLGNRDHNQSSIYTAVKTIRRQKAGIQSLLRLLDGIESCNQERQSRQYYQCNLNTVDRYWTQVEAYNNKIWELTEDPTLAGYDVQENIDLEQRVQQTTIKLSERLAQVSNEPVINNVAMKLPKIVVPIFDGNYLKWRQFHDLFTQMVHNQPLSGCEKMWYLKTNLKGEAEKLIRHFSISNENYTAAWEMLRTGKKISDCWLQRF